MVTSCPIRGSSGSATRYWRHFVIVADAAKSQVDTLRETLRAGVALDGPIACLSLDGRGFRGQRGRRWVTQSGNLHLAAAVPVNAAASAVVPALAMLPALAVLDAVGEVHASHCSAPLSVL